MENLEMNLNLDFDIKKHKANVIKVVGVGGGGGNAVNYMYQKGIKDVDFVIVNTDAQDLRKSPIPIKIQIGRELTEGLGAGAIPEIGRKAAEEDLESLKKVLEDNTKMIFITAGMGGGTGTGAAPVIAKLAREMGILTVGIVTSPFEFEGRKRLKHAEEGIEELRQYVDSLIIINNNKLREVFGNLKYHEAFAKSDEILAKAASSISEVITLNYKVNVDFRDVRTVLENSGTAIMGSATASGENRAQKVIEAALDSPLLNDNKIVGAKNVLLLIVSGSEEITLDEMSEINYYVQNEAGNTADIILGIGTDERLNDEIGVTIIATGFPNDQQDIIANTKPDRKVHFITKEREIVNPPEMEITKPHEEENDMDEHKLIIDEYGNKQLILDFDDETRNIVAEEKFQIDNPYEFKNTHDNIQDNQQVLFDEFSMDIEEESKPESEEERKVYKLDDYREDQVEETFSQDEKLIENENDIEKEERISEPVLKSQLTNNEKEIVEENSINLDELGDITELPFEKALELTQKRKSNLRKYVDTIPFDEDDTPAYEKQGIHIDTTPKSEQSVSKMEFNGEDFRISDSNSFLFDNVD